MSTTIEWTNEVWNPTTGCNKVSRGCKNCYAEKMHKRLQGMKMPGYNRNFLEGAYPNGAALTRPFKWKKPRKVFVNSMSDLFHHNIPFEYVDHVFAVMALTPQHTYQILTKRPERMAEYFSEMPWERVFHIGEISQLAYINRWSKKNNNPNFPLPNVWLGTSVENQAAADERIPHLLNCPAAVRFLSMEPLVWPVNLNNIVEKVDGGFQSSTCLAPHPVVDNATIHWVIVGGESGSKATPIHPDWVRSLRNQCEHAGVPFFFKQWGQWCPREEYSFASGSPDLASCKRFTFPDGQEVYKVGKHHSGNTLDGRTYLEFPAQ
jgi:protein gp37